ncbi:MAG: RNA-binding domain-containing protein [Nitrososphaerota archaeon]
MEGVISVSVEADVYPTEDPEKVLKAVKAIFPEISFEVKWLDSYARVEGSAEGYGVLENLKRLLRERRIRAAARSILKSSMRDDILVFYLNKQAAYAGKASFTEPFIESPLPPIKVMIKAPNLEEVISWLTE